MLMDKILITSSISIENLQVTSLGFVNQARAEIIDLVFSAIEKADEELGRPYDMRHL
ncbi:hypothetical protein D3C86_2249210 [compost metagenome]